MKNPKNNSKSRDQSDNKAKVKQPYDQKRNRKKNKSKDVQKTGRPNQRHSSSNNTPKPRIKVDLYGMHAVTQAWTNPNRQINALYITEKALTAFDQALTKAHDLGLKRPTPQIVPKSMLESSTSQGSVHQGIGLDCAPLDEVDVNDIIRAEAPKERSVLIMLDQVTDPHNVGAIIRSSCAFGAGGMIMQKKYAPELTGVLAKTACGGAEHLPVAYETNLTRSIQTLQEAGYFAIGLAEEGKIAISSLSEAHQKMLLVLGAEGDGLRRLVREQCDALVSLPTAGPVSSLNVSNAAAVALYTLSA